MPQGRAPLSRPSFAASTTPSAKLANDAVTGKLSARGSGAATTPDGFAPGEAVAREAGSAKLASEVAAGESGGVNVALDAAAELTLGEVLAAARAAQQMPTPPGRLKAWRAAWPKW